MIKITHEDRWSRVEVLILTFDTSLDKENSSLSSNLTDGWEETGHLKWKLIS